MSVNEDQAKELHKPVTEKFNRRKFYTRFKDNIWERDLAKEGLLSLYNWYAEYLLCVIDVFTKYAWVIAFKDKKGKTGFHDFIEIVTNLNVNQINYGLIKEKNVRIALYNNV